MRISLAFRGCARSLLPNQVTPCAVPPEQREDPGQDGSTTEQDPGMAMARSTAIARQNACTARLAQR